MANNAMSVGGQAFPVGVLMRGKRNAVAYSRADGQICIKTWAEKKEKKLPRVPVLRGLVALGRAAADGAVTTAALIKNVKDPAKNGSTVSRIRKYHGAEHKAIACYEQGLELTAENVMKQSRIHPRCGTTVAVNVLIAQGIMRAALPWNMDPQKRETLELVATVLAFGLGYELSRKAWRGESELAWKLTAPGRWAQKLTTAEPDQEMISCAIAAIEAAVGQNDPERQ